MEIKGPAQFGPRRWDQVRRWGLLNRWLRGALVGAKAQIKRDLSVWHLNSFCLPAAWSLGTAMWEKGECWVDSSRDNLWACWRHTGGWDCQVQLLAKFLFSVWSWTKFLKLHMLHFRTCKRRTIMGFPSGSMVKNLPSKQETKVWSLRGREDPLEEKMATHSSILVWEISWREEPGGL